MLVWDGCSLRTAVQCGTIHEHPFWYRQLFSSSCQQRIGPYPCIHLDETSSGHTSITPCLVFCSFFSQFAAAATFINRPCPMIVMSAPLSILLSAGTPTRLSNPPTTFCVWCSRLPSLVYCGQEWGEKMSWVKEKETVPQTNPKIPFEQQRKRVVKLVNLSHQIQGPPKPGTQGYPSSLSGVGYKEECLWSLVAYHHDHRPAERFVPTSIWSC